MPRSMFAVDGTMLHCSSKNTSVNILEKMDPRRNTERSNEEVLTVITGMAATQVSIVDTMAEVQALDKPDWIKSCSQLAEHSTMYVFENYNDCNVLWLIFDRLVIHFNLIFFLYFSIISNPIQKVVSVEKLFKCFLLGAMCYFLVTLVSRQLRWTRSHLLQDHWHMPTHIAKVPMKRLLSRVNTKMELTQGRCSCMRQPM